VFQIIAPTALFSLPYTKAIAMARFSASSQGAGARGREPAVSLPSSPQVPLDSLVLRAERVCSASRMGRRRSPGWEKGWRQGHLLSPRGAWGDCHLFWQHSVATGRSLSGLHISLGKILLLVNTPLPNISTNPESRGFTESQKYRVLGVGKGLLEIF